MIELFEKFPKIVRSDPSLFYGYIPLLAEFGRLPEALSHLRQCKIKPDRMPRTYLKAIVLLRGNATESALELFGEIWNRRRIGRLPLSLNTAILAAAVREKGPWFAKDLLGKLEVGADSSDGPVIWVLQGIFHRERLRWLAAMSRSEFAKPSEKSLETMACEALVGVPQKENHPVLIDFCSRWQNFRQRHPAFFPDPNFVFDDALEIADRIATAIDSKQPLSLVRLGDGEGNLLPYREDFRYFESFDRRKTQRVWWAGDRPDGGRSEEIPELLQEAITDADIVGVPDLQRVCRVLAVERSGGPLTHGIGFNSKNARGLIAALDFSLNLPADRVITSCHIHESLAYWGLWDLLIPRARRVSLITCHSQLAGKLGERFGVGIGEVHVIPPEKRYSRMFENEAVERHFPDTFLELREKLAGARPGEVFLVAAGMLGKTYCQWIKQAGGIGLDIGSAADHWCGFVTRGLDEQAAYMRPYDMVEQIRRLAGEDARVARLTEGR